MNPNIQNVAALIGRILLVILFVKSGWGKIPGFEGTAAYMASKGLPMAQVLLVASIFIELAGAAMIAIGFKARWGAAAVFLWMIPVTLVFHAFWAIPDAKEAGMQQIHFLKNLAIMGGLAMVYAFGPGRYSLDKS